ncbi:Alpha/beta knot methyltransferases [Syntrophomonas zehnderi OL-4]|uniref:Ribosomal RNA large subunit methyltransferase H n=1 Tax=Syntrophomonas zehnderi OL-4 TaxID=690567 RepID=A0A0E4G9A8_9FIRM|nr:Alpha/beta knot methyltransferases [Syntrophomonas zehnderi OL-4]
MKYRIISVGRIRENFYQEGIKEYLKRLTAYTAIEMLDGLEEKISPRSSEKEIARILQKEGDRILALLGDNEILIVLDPQGEALSSEQLAVRVQELNLQAKTRINLVIGGAHGLAPPVKQRADQTISLSKMTFPHQMAVLLLTEQLYRSFKILKGEPYHK